MSDKLATKLYAESLRAGKKGNPLLYPESAGKFKPDFTPPQRLITVKDLYETFGPEGSLVANIFKRSSWQIKDSAIKKYLDIEDMSILDIDPAKGGDMPVPVKDGILKCIKEEDLEFEEYKEPDPPKLTGYLSVSPKSIELTAHREGDGGPGGSHAMYWSVSSLDLSIKSLLLDSGGTVIRPLDVDFYVTPSNSNVYTYGKVVDFGGRIKITVSSDIGGGKQGTGVVHIVLKETGLEETVNVTINRTDLA